MARWDDIRPGDLIEASVQVDIEIARDPFTSVPSMSVYFSFSKLIRLCQRLRLSEVRLEFGRTLALGC